MNNLSEHDLQASIVAECDLRANQDPRWGFIMAIPNGGQRDIRVAQKLKVEGVRAGVPDLFMPVPERGFSGLWMELKVGRNKPTYAQQIWLTNLLQMGYYTCVVYDDPNEAIRIITWYLEAEQ